MAIKGSTKRYAQAVFSLALETNKLEDWQDGLKKIVSLTSDKKLMALLENPSLLFAAKEHLLQERLGKIDQQIYNLAALLVSKNLLRFGKDLSQRYDDFLYAHRGLERANITSASSLDTPEKEAISQQLGKMVDRKIVMETQVDPSLIGGFVARIGDTLIDGSIQQKLETLRRNLVEGNR